MSLLNVIDRLPAGLLECDARDLAALLPGPTLIHLPGRQTAPLFLTVLLHGNETTGFDALRAILTRHLRAGLPRALSVFIGNVAAAAQGVRTLPGQSDYNRVWPGTPMPHLPEADLMRQVFDQIAARQPFASIDLHNNSGINPYYGCVARLVQPFLHLARLFSRVVVYIEAPLGVQSIALASLCPAVTVECGRIGTQEGIARAAELIEACLTLSHFPAHDIARNDIELLHTVAVVRVPPQATISFDDSVADIRFRADIDHLNFSPLAAGTVLARTAPMASAELEVVPAYNGREVRPWLEYTHGEIRLARPAIPAMLTRDPQAVRADCLCYLMEPLAPP